MANPDGKLLPGMFASLLILLPNPQPQVVVPESAITYTLYGNSVYVASPKRTRTASRSTTTRANPSWSPNSAR